MASQAIIRGFESRCPLHFVLYTCGAAACAMVYAAFLLCMRVIARSYANQLSYKLST